MQSHKLICKYMHKVKTLQVVCKLVYINILQMK